MPTEEYKSVTITDFRGPWTRVEASDVPSEGALLAENVEWDPGQIRSRYGFTSLFAAGEPMGAMCDWIRGTGIDLVFPTGRALTFINPTTHKARIAPNLSSFSAVDLFTLSDMVAADFAFAGTRQFIAPLKADGTSAGQCRIVQAYGSAIQTDKAFQGPISATLTAVENSNVSVNDAGVHRFAYRIQSRTGFTGPLCPVVSGTFAPVEVTLVGGKQVVLTVNTTWPAEASLVFFCVATPANLNDWYQLSSAGVAVPGGSAYSASFIVDINDDDIRGTAINVTDEASLFTQDASGNGPFNPYNVVEVGERMGYIATVTGIDTMFVSEPSKHQVFTADQHGLVLPGFRKMTTGAMLLSSLFIIGPKWTYATSDNGDKPVNWPAMRLVDGAIGTPAPRGVSANPSTGYMWVASTGGLYLFEGGAYADKPVSYYVDDWWGRINWDNPGLLEVKDFPHKQKVAVKAVLRASVDGSSPAGTYLLVFDYTKGTDPEKVAFTPWTFKGFTVGAIENGVNPTTNAQEIWIASGNSSFTNVYRQKSSAIDASPFLDDFGGGGGRYETALSPPIKARGVGKTFQHHGAHLRITGGGGINLTLKGIGGKKSAILRPVVLETEPGKEILRRGHIVSEAASLLIETNSDTSYFILSAVQNYFTPGATRT